MKLHNVGMGMLAAGAVAVAAFSGSATAGTESNEVTAEMKSKYVRPKSIPYPKDNPYSKAKEALGKALFFDPRLSRSGVMTCATCHNPSLHWADGHGKGIGDFHKVLDRKDPTVLNLAWDELFFWDGRADSLESQAIGPIKAEGEMNLPHDAAIERLKAIKGYQAMFKAAFPEDADPVNIGNVGKAIATYERGIISGEAPFDKWIKGDEKAISASAKNGFALFNTKANCSACHSSWRFSDGSYQDIGINDADLGRGKILDLPAMQHAFKTVGLRNIAQRGPYMHDGSAKTLEDVINHYDHGFVKRDSLSPQIKQLNLTENEKKDLVAFLKTLTSVDAPVSLPVLPNQGED